MQTAESGHHRLAEGLGRARIPGLDALRAFAVVTMILYDRDIPFVPGFGVTVFFVLSGFLATWWLVEEERSTGRIRPYHFWARRAARILPALWAYCAFVIALALLQGSDVPWSAATSSLLLVQNFRLALGDGTWTAFGFAWILSVQAQFFLLWPLLLMWLARARESAPRRLVTIILALWTWRLLLVGLGVDERYRFVAFDARVDAILVGCLLAILLRWGGDAWVGRLAPKSPLALLAVLAALLAAFWGVDRWDAWYRDVVARALEPALVALVLVYVVAYARSPGLRWLDSAPLRYLSTIALGMCLFHGDAFLVADRIPGSTSTLSTTALGLALTVAAGTASFYVVERPFLRRSGHGAHAGAPQKPA